MEGNEGFTPTQRPGPRRIGTSNLRDVADLAGVSLSTASRVLSDASGVSPASRAKVFRAASDLNYVVNGLARSMTGRGARTIAFVVEEMVGPTFSAMAAGVEEIASPAGHLFVVSATHGDPQVEQRLIKTMCEQRASAVMLIGNTATGADYVTAISAYHSQLREAGTQLLLLGRPPVTELPQIPSIDYDHQGGVASAVAHLASLGHRRIAYLGREEGTTAHARLSGYRDGLKTASIRFNPNLVVGTENRAKSGEDAMVDLLDQTTPRPTGVVCETDNIAVGVYRAAAARNLSVPNDISVTGFDDLPLVSDLTPALTTVRAPFREVGTVAGQIAVGQLPYEQRITLPTELLVRHSARRT